MECHLSGVEGAWAYGWETSTSFHSLFAEEAAQTFHYLVAATCCSTSTWSTWWTPEMKNAVRLKQSCWALLAFGILDTPVRYQLKQNLGDFWKAFVWFKVIRADHQKIFPTHCLLDCYWLQLRMHSGSSSNLSFPKQYWHVCCREGSLETQGQLRSLGWLKTCYKCWGLS